MSKISFVLLVEIDNCEQFGERRFVKRFMMGICELRPAFPRYAVTWDVDLVLYYLGLLFPLDKFGPYGAAGL